jgi:hypothetical protein
VFRDADSGLVVNVGVKYECYAEYGNKPYAIKIGLAVAKTAKDAFEFLDNAIAGANYGKNLGQLICPEEGSRRAGAA